MAFIKFFNPFHNTSFFLYPQEMLLTYWRLLLLAYTLLWTCVLWHVGSFLSWWSGFDLTTSDSHFTVLVEVFTNHILAKNTNFTNHMEWIEHKTTVLKPANNHQIIRRCQSQKNYQRLSASCISLSSKNFVNIPFYEA